jgi:hypothetical protein
MMTYSRNELEQVCYETAFAAGRQGKVLVCARLIVWILTHAGRITDAELRARVNAIRAKIGMPAI